ncbi:MAG: phosphodiesterase [Betaproteobacteria bacterium]|nr:phosphodiesterase [Betaproteobacteria bacterium]
MIIAQISDLHVGVKGRLVYDRFDTGLCLQRCVQHILRLNPATHVVLATGDLVDGGTAEEYRHLRELLAPLPMPVYLIPGNHDDRAALCKAFGDHVYLPRPGAPVYYVLEEFPVRLLALDTVVPGAAGGALDAAQLDWLEARLAAAPARPALIFMHHPPFRTGIRCMDEIGLDAASAGRLGTIVSGHRQVERIVCGHVHRGIQARWHGTTVSICPSTAFQGILDLKADRFDWAPDEPPAYQLHCWNGTELVTHTVVVTSGR